MKTKLLKKVRKRYEIFRVDSIDRHYWPLDDWLRVIAGIQEYKTPFYIATDKERKLTEWIFLDAQTRSGIYTKLIDEIRQEYYNIK